MGKGNLNQAKVNKNDEFYTRLTDIEKELRYYRDQLKGKHIFMNCDDPDWSNFWQYFELNFKFLGLKKITSTHYHDTESTYRLDYDGDGIVKTPLEGNGDFRSPEAVEILKECDIVITNPPFSLYREYVAQLMEYEKDFLIIGNFNSVTYKEIFPLIKEDKMWTGYSPRSMEFDTPEGGVKNVNAKWFTNLDVSKRHEEMILFKPYLDSEYPRYDNYDAIEVGRVNNIPVDFKGVMGVPITFLERYNPDQFIVMGMAAGNSRATGLHYEVPYTPNSKDRGGCGVISGKRKYARILIQRRDI